MAYHFEFGAILEYVPVLVKGIAITVELIAIGAVIGVGLGIVCAWVRTFGPKWLRPPVSAYVELIRNTPFLVQIYFIFFALPFIGVILPPTPTAIIALGVNGGAYAIEIIRGGVQSIHKGQIEAGYALGLHKAQVFRLIVLKPALRAIYPSLTSQFILLTLTTSVASAISAYELTSTAQRIESDTFRSFEVYFTVTAFYLVMSWLMMTMFNAISRRYFSYPVK